jgi:hypothetical protein
LGYLTTPKTLLNNVSPYPLMLVSVVTEHDVCCGVAADARRVSEVCVDRSSRPLSACCGASETVEDARRKIREHRATNLPV